MFGLLSRVLGYILVGVCLTALSFAFFSIAALIRLLPRMLHLAHRGLRAFLLLSFRLYRLLLTRLAPFAHRYLKVNVLAGYSRVVASVVLSLMLGLLFLCATRLTVNGWGVGLSLLHGLSVGFLWDEIEAPRVLRLGLRMQ